MKYSILSALFLLSSLFASAQSNYKPGYVVSLNGDTSKGFIDYKEWDANPRKILFKGILAEQPKPYSANNSNGFGVTGYEYYAKFILPVGKDRTDVANLFVGPNTATVIDTLFLKILASGKKVTLYSYWDNIKQRFFIAAPGAVPSELVYRIYYDPEQTSKTIKQSIYKRQLSALATADQPGNSGLINTIQNAEYDEHQLQHIAVLLNGDGETKSLTYKSQTGFRLFAGIGLNNSIVSIHGNDNSSGSESSAFPALNLGIDFFLNKDIRSLMIRTELSFTANNISLTSSNSDYTSNLNFKQFIVSFSPQLLYNIYNTPSTKIYISAGILIDFNAYSDKSNTVNFRSGFEPASVAFPDVQSIFIVPDVKAGVVFNERINIFAGYVPSTTINQDLAYSLKISSYQVGINYLFGK